MTPVKPGATPVEPGVIPVKPGATLVEPGVIPVKSGVIPSEVWCDSSITLVRLQKSRNSRIAPGVTPVCLES